MRAFLLFLMLAPWALAAQDTARIRLDITVHLVKDSAKSKPDTVVRTVYDTVTRTVHDTLPRRVDTLRSVLHDTVTVLRRDSVVWYPRVAPAPWHFTFDLINWTGAGSKPGDVAFPNIQPAPGPTPSPITIHDTVLKVIHDTVTITVPVPVDVSQACAADSTLGPYNDSDYPDSYGNRTVYNACGKYLGRVVGSWQLSAPADTAWDAVPYHGPRPSVRFRTIQDAMLLLDGKPTKLPPFSGAAELPRFYIDTRLNHD